MTRIGPRSLMRLFTAPCFALLVLAQMALGGEPKAAVERSETGTTTRRDIGALTPPSPLGNVPDELLVRLKPGVSAAEIGEALSSVPSVSRREFRSVPNLHHLTFGSRAALREGLRLLRRHRDVEYVEPNYVMRAFGVPNDPQFTSQWALRNTGQTGGTAGADIAAVGAWDVTTGSSNMVVATLDTGIDYGHEDLVANVFSNTLDCDSNGIDDDDNGYADDCHGIDTVNQDSDPMDDHGHGTHVAGIIGAHGNNALGVAGVTWQVKLLSCKFLDSAGEGDTAGAIACLDYVALMRDRGVNIVATNNSWGGGLYSQALLDAIQAQRARGILFVVAAGNSGADNDGVLTYPCSYFAANIVCVASTNASDGRAATSNYGRTTVHVGAPGDSILSTLPGHTYGLASGTSMAAPHVTGVAALLYAQNPSRDWRAVKNLILAGGTDASALQNTISHKRLSAAGSLGCSGGSVISRVRPSGSVLVGVGSRVDLAVLNIVCDSPAGEVSVAIAPGDVQVDLHDDGLDRDEVEGDGLYSGAWWPSGAGQFTLTFPDGSEVAVTVDPHLKPGFPVKAYDTSGSYQGGQAIHTLVGDIDGDPELEILVTGLAQGPLYAWNADGSAVAGWPGADPPGAVYPALGELSASPGMEVFSTHYGADPDLFARAGSGLLLAGWPRQSANYVAAPPTLADIAGTSLDEMLTEEEDWHLHAYNADATVVAGWPTTGYVGGQERHTPAVADLDGDGDLEIVTVSGSGSSGTFLLAHHHDGSTVAGFPVNFNGYVNTFPVIGDVDGDGSFEIVVAGRVSSAAGAYVYSSSGVLEATLPTSTSVGYGTAPALADLDGDGVPEIILQTDTTLHAWRGDGTPCTGWPVTVGSGTWLRNAGPVVGDLDGDGLPEVVALALPAGVSGATGNVLVFTALGVPLPAFRKQIPIDSAAVPAIADIDRDGRNDLVITSSYWNGYSGYHDKVWVYDFGGPTPHGPVHWSQFMGGPKHQGRYELTPPAGRSVVSVIRRTGHGAGAVLSDPAGIQCGIACSAIYENGTEVTLTAVPAAGSFFNGWGGACSGQGNPCTIVVSGNLGLTADFALPHLTIGDVTVTEEGNCGTKQAVFTVNLSAGTGGVTVNYATVDGTATAGSDYEEVVGGVLSFGVGVTQQPIVVTIHGDAVFEAGETFSVTLSDPVNAVIVDGTGVGTIVNDDRQVLPGEELVSWGNTLGASQCGADLVKTGTAGGWNAGASSTRAIASGDGYAEFTVTAKPVYMMAGLSHGDTDTTYQDIDYEVYICGNGHAYALEGTSQKWLGTYEVGDVFRVEMLAGSVRYLRNGVVKYEHAVTPSYPVLLDTSLYTAGVVLGSAVIAGTLVDAEATEGVVWTNKVNATSAGNTLTKSVTAGVGWNAGASSTRGLAGNGYAQFMVMAKPVYMMVGLSHGDADTTYQDIDYEIYICGNGHAYALEGASQTWLGTYEVGDIFRIEIRDGSIRYIRNGVVKYEHPVTPTYPLLLDTSLYTPGVQVSNALLSGTIVDASASEAVEWTSQVNTTSTGGTLTKNAGAPLGWNAGAVSTKAIASGEGYAEFTVSANNVYWMAGLSSGNTDTSYQDIDYEIYICGNGHAYALEGATQKWLGTYTAGDVFRIEIQGGMLKYKKNNVTKYEHAFAPPYPLLLDTSLYTPGAQVTNAILAGTLE